MKRLLFYVTVLTVLSFSTMAQKTWVGFTSDIPGTPQVLVEEQDQLKVILDVTISGMYVAEYTQEGRTFQRLELIEDRTTKDIGKPELPMISELIGIPGNQLVRVNILEKETIKLSNYLVYPFQTPTTDNPGGQNKPFVLNQKFYSLSNTYPVNQVYMDQPGIWRDVKIAGLHVVPFNYHTSSKELEVITHLRLEIEFYDTDPNFAFNPNKKVNPNFFKMYQAQILNFQSLGYTLNPKSNDDIKYLIITNTEALGSIQPLVDWKNQQGFRVEVKTLQTGFITPQNFKDYITQLYNNDGLEYILMVGDAYPNGGNPPGTNDVPMYYWAPGGEDASYSDSWYTCMNGPDDHYADIAIGRIVYDNLAELDLQIQKTIDHYFNPDATTNWAENTILIAHMEEYPGKYTQCCEEIRTFPYSLQVPIFQQAYGGAGYTNAQVVNYVNANSCGIFNYRGHGSSTELWEWSPSGSFTAQHVNQLTNQDRLFVFFDVCCDNMDIVAYSGNCLCESFMKSPVASVAANGAIIPSYTIPNHDYDKEMYKAVFEEGIYNIGYVTNFANITVLVVHGDLGRSNVRTYLWLGDASIEPWTLQPANLTVTHDAQLFLGLSNFTVNVLGTGGPLENAMVCVSNEDQTVYGVAYTDASGNAEIVFDGPVQNPGTAKVTVTAHNHLPYQAEIPVIPQSGPYVVKDSFSLNDLTGGNGDGLMDYGESILLSLAIKNVGIAQATNVIVTLTTTDPYITFTANTYSYGNIGPDQVIMATDAFAFNVANDIPDGHYVLINVEANGGNDDIWNSNFSLGGHAPVLSLGEITISDPAGNNNGKIDPGETVNLVITAENTGSSEAFNLVGEISEMDPFLTINTAQVNYGDIPGGNNATGIFSVTAAANTPAGHMVEITFDMSADLGITGTGNFDVVIGQIPVLIIDLDGNHNSAPAMEATLADMEVAYETTTAIPPDLNLYSTVFLCLGIYSNNYTLTSAEGQTFANYLNNGGSMYMEGGDTWAYDAQTAVHAMFKIDGVADGSGDMSIVAGQAGTFTEGLSFNYNGDNNWMDHIEPIAPAVKIFVNQSPVYGTGVAYDGGTYKTIGTSHEFGGLVDGASPSTKEELMSLYLDFLGISQSLQAMFNSSTTETCTEEIVNFYDQSSGGAISWEWTFEGGSPASSTSQNPLVAYFNTGNFDVSLTVSDGIESNTVVMENYITVTAVPQIPGTPTGENIICTNWAAPTAYTTTGATNAESYVWEIQPAAAGTISGTGATATITWTLNWEGTATLRVKGYNEPCGEGEFSAGFDVVCSICTGINEQADLAGIQIYPNPSNGKLTINFDSNVGMTEISVVNMLNKVVFSDKSETMTGKTLNIDLGNLAKGVYFIKLKTDRHEETRKIIIQ
jgi:PKD repeat protein